MVLVFIDQDFYSQLLHRDQMLWALKTQESTEQWDTTAEHWLCFPAFPAFRLIVKNIMGPPGPKKRASASPIDKEKAIPAGSWGSC